MYFEMPNCLGNSVNKSKKDDVIRKSTCRKSLSASCSAKDRNQDSGKGAESAPLCCASQNQTLKVNAGNGLHDIRYHTPQMNTILREVNQLKHVENLQPTLLRKDMDLTPRSKAAIAPKVNQKLNFNADEVVFKNLTPLNVNDSILIQNQCHARPNKFIKTNKVPAPDLYHWLERQAALKLTIPEPELTLEFCDTVIDPFECYNHLLN